MKVVVGVWCEVQTPNFVPQPDLTWFDSVAFWPRERASGHMECNPLSVYKSRRVHIYLFRI